MSRGEIGRTEWEKFKILHLGRRNVRHKTRMGETCLERSTGKRGPNVFGDPKLNRGQQQLVAAKKANAT